MLNALRRGAQGWLAKILFVLLIVSFGVFWNVSDVFRQAGRGTIAKVGEADVTVEDFQVAYQNQLRSLQHEDGRPISNEQALLLGVDRQVLDRLIAQAAVTQHAKDLGLALSDKTLAEGLQSDPNFAGADGKFSRVGFQNLLSRLGMSEARFFQIRRDDELRRQLSEALQGAIVVPDQMVADAHAWNNETRTLTHFSLDPLKVKVDPASEEKLKDVYETNKPRFMTPEYRNLAAVYLSVDDLKKEVKLTDEEVRQRYDETKANYDKPERRRVQQIAFDSKDKAVAAREELVAGKKSFLEVAKDAGASEKDVNLGLVEKAKLIDPAIADVVFSLERDKLSEVVDGKFATVLVRAIEIQPGEKSTFEGAKEKVRDELATTRAREMIHDRYDLVEEARNAGRTLKEVSEELKVRFSAADAVDAENKAPDGKDAIDLPEATQVIKAAFGVEPGTQNDAIELTSDSFAWFDVISVEKPKQKDFETVKDDVKSFYEDQEQARLLNEMAQKFADRAKKGESMEALATEAGGKVDVTETVMRNASPPGLTAEAIKQAFGLPEGGAGYADTSDRSNRVVFRVKGISPAEAPTKEEKDRLVKKLRSGLEEDVLLSYVAALQDEFGVQINGDLLARATGASTDQ